MKTVLITLLFALSLFAFEMKAGLKYTGWPEKDTVLHGVVQLEADTFALNERDHVQVLYLVDISRESAGRVRQGLIEGGKKIVNALRPDDRFGIVVYSKYARTLMPLTAMSEESKAEAIELLERITTEDGRNMTAALEKVNAEFILRSGEKIDGKYLIASALGPVSEGEEGRYLLEEFLAGAAEDSLDYSIYTVGYGETFDENIMINSAEISGGRGFFVPKDRPDSMLTIFDEIAYEVTNPIMRDVEVFFNFPDSDVELRNFDGTAPLQNPFKIKHLARGQKYRIVFSMKNRPERSSALDVDVDYYSLQTKTPLSVTGGTKLPVTTEAIYSTEMAPPIIQFSILEKLGNNLPMFRRVETEMSPLEAKQFRKDYAFKFQTEVVNRVETVRNEINTPEIEYTAALMKAIFEELRDGVYETEYMIRRVKYNQHYTIYGK